MKREQLSTDITRIQFDSMEEWLVNRKGIGGSDASAILGLNPYKTNQELWIFARIAVSIHGQKRLTVLSMEVSQQRWLSAKKLI